MGARLIHACALIALASLIASCDRSLTLVEQTRPDTDTACFGCHGDGGAMFTAIHQQWERSVHASGANIDRSASSCNPCHTAEGFVAVSAGADASVEVDDPSPIHCFACHAPHERGDLSLRITAVVELSNGERVDMGRGNLCGACHQSRHDVAAYVGTGNDPVEFTSSHWGPHHSPQTDIFAATNGYEYPPVPYFGGPHRTRLPDGCLHCHVDAGDGMVLGGHTMRMRSGAASDQVLNVAACDGTGCHPGLEDFDHHDIQSDVGVLLALLQNELRVAGLIDDQGHPIAGRAVAGADTAGAVWNYLIVIEDGSYGVHNPDYVLDLLGSSLLFMGGTLPSPARDGSGPENSASIRARRRLQD